VLRLEPPTQDQAKPIELGLASFEPEPLAGDCDGRDALGRSWRPQIEVYRSVRHTSFSPDRHTTFRDIDEHRVFFVES
jgi:hypothetical protein